MKSQSLVAMFVAGLCAAALSAGPRGGLSAQQRAMPLARATSAGLNGLLASSLLFMAADANKDGAVTRDELKTTVRAWFTEADAASRGSVTLEQLVPVLDRAMPTSALAAAHRRFRCESSGGAAVSPSTVTVMASTGQPSTHL